MSWIKMFAIFGLVSNWLIEASKDGVIDQTEIVSLVTQILNIAGVDAEIKVTPIIAE